MKENFFNTKGKYHRYMYFIIAGILFGSLLGSVVQGCVGLENTPVIYIGSGTNLCYQFAWANNYTFPANGTLITVSPAVGNSVPLRSYTVFCALYDENFNLVENGISKNVTVTSTTVKFKKLYFADGGATDYSNNPRVEAGKNYSILVFADGASGRDCVKLGRYNGYGLGRYYDARGKAYQYPPPNDMTWTNASWAPWSMSLYCGWDRDEPIIITGNIPKNETENIEMTDNSVETSIEISWCDFNAESLFENTISEDSQASHYIKGDLWQSQSFESDTTFWLTRVRLKLGKIYGAEGTLELGIRLNSSKDEEDLGYGEYEDISDFTTSLYGLVYTIYMDEPILIEAGTVYAMVLRSPDATEYVRLRINTLNVYENGIIMQSTNSGVSWTNYSERDCIFGLYGYDNYALNVSFWSNYTGEWKRYYNESIFQNQMVSCYLPDLTWETRYWWNVSTHIPENSHYYFENNHTKLSDKFWFETNDEDYVEFLLAGILELPIEIIGLIVVALLFAWAEKKRDFILYSFTGFLSLVLGIFYLTRYFNLLEIGMWLGIVFVFFSIYCFALALGSALSGHSQARK